jgi:hypothetical protein
VSQTAGLAWWVGVIGCLHKHTTCVRCTGTFQESAWADWTKVVVCAGECLGKQTDRVWMARTYLSHVVGVLTPRPESRGGFSSDKPDRPQV